MAAKKSTRKTAGKKKAVAKKKVAAKKPASAATSKATKKAKATGKASSLNVNMGHVFALRPRIETSFRQADFLTARHLLEGEAYASLAEAARAVADKALALTHDGPGRYDPRR